MRRESVPVSPPLPYFLMALRRTAKLAALFTIVAAGLQVIGSVPATGGVDRFVAVAVYWTSVPLVAVVLTLLRAQLARPAGALFAGWCIFFPIALVVGALFRPQVVGGARIGVSAVLGVVLAVAYLPRIRSMAVDPGRPVR